MAASGFQVATLRHGLDALEHAHLEKVIAVDAVQLDDASFHDRMLRAEEGASDRAESVTTWIMSSLVSIVGLVGVIGVIGSVGPEVGVLAILSIVPVVIAQRKGFGIAKQVSNETAVLRRKRIYLRQLATQQDSGAEVRAMNAGPALTAMRNSVSREYLVGGAFLAGAFVVVGLRAGEGQASAGDVAVLLASLATIIGFATNLSNGWSQIVGNAGFVDDLFSFLDTPAVVTTPADPHLLADPLPGTSLMRRDVPGSATRSSPRCTESERPVR